jgi:hypothetical protein
MTDAVGPVELCDLCIAMGGRFNAHRECCRVRLVAGMPHYHRLQVYQRMKDEAGSAAMVDFKRRVGAEYQRLQEKKRGAVRAACASILEIIKKDQHHGRQ